eukprot:11350796-Heterocapsa_arctica.AAC.1
MSFNMKGPKNTTSKASADLTSAHHRAAIKKINALLQDNPAKIFPALAIIEGDDLLQHKKSESHWHPTTVHFKGIPKYWMQEYLGFCVTGSAEKLSIIDGSSSDAVRKVFNFCHMLDDSTKIPRSALDKEIFSQMLQK